MADRAIHRERSLHVARIGRTVVVRHVAQIACAAGQVVVVVDVTLRALQVGVAVGERESDRVVIEVGGLPRRRVVAKLASCGEIRRKVVWVGGLLIIRHMAPVAGGRSAFELIVNVTGTARQGRVCAGQRVTGKLKVVKTNVEPSVETVALLARGREPGGGVGRPGCRLVVLGVAGIARG